jgi:hypothetical protein
MTPAIERLIAAVAEVLAHAKHGASYGSWTGIDDEAMHELERAYAALKEGEPAP